MVATAPAKAKPCHARSKRCGNARRYDAVLRSCCRAHVVRLSRIAAEAFRAADIPFWADYGTLLGAVRNPLTTRHDYPWLPQDQLPEGPIAPGILPHDKDADWGLPAEYFAQARRALRIPGVREKLKLIVRPHKASIKLRISAVNHTNLDLFFWETVPAGRVVEHTRFDETVELGPGMMYRRTYVGVDRFKGKEFHRDQLYPLTAVTWEGMSLPAPRDPEAFLAMRYGDAWRDPIPANNGGIESLQTSNSSDHENRSTQ